MFKIIHAAFIAPGIKRFVIEAPRVARKQKPGQFVILRLYEQGERIPLTIERSDPERGTINIVVQSAGKTTHLLNSFETGDRILDVVGPLGKPSEIKNFGTVVVMAVAMTQIRQATGRGKQFFGGLLGAVTIVNLSFLAGCLTALLAPQTALGQLGSAAVAGGATFVVLVVVRLFEGRGRKETTPRG